MMHKMTAISEEQLTMLRADISQRLSEKRLAHTIGVEEMAARMGRIYCPEKVGLLRAAALLHDITKELSSREHALIFEKYGLSMSEELISSPKTHHSMTAALEIPRLYPSLSSKELIDAVRYHTTGRAQMSLPEKIIYLADYIDMTRTFDDCIALREMFWGADPEGMTECEREEHLDRVLLASFDMTVKDLLENKRVISRDTVDARNDLIIRLKNKNHKGE